MKGESPKVRLKQELRRLLRSMDFVTKRYLTGKGRPVGNAERFAEIYQQLGLAWEFLGLQCHHEEGYRRTGEGRFVCRICGKVKGVADLWMLLPASGTITLGQKRFPGKRCDLPNKQAAVIDASKVRFHGAKLSVEVHNSYRSNLFGRAKPINIAADRIVRLWEGDVECWLDSHLVHVKWKRPGRKPHKPPYGAFPAELPRRILKKFPLLVEYDDRDRLVGVNILIPPHRRQRR
jgi:hypothetical protein